MGLRPKELPPEVTLSMDRLKYVLFAAAVVQADTLRQAMHRWHLK